MLDVVHSLIERTDKKFILTGSSARKLKQGGANLLAGRAFVYHLFPFSFLELGEQFNLQAALQWGLLPKIEFLNTDQEKLHFLQAYALTYLKEEIWAEQFIKKLDPFRKFLEVAAQCNGKIINYANISRDVGVDDKTIKEYFSILEDTLIGFVLEPFQHSFRKRLSLKSKFYFFDVGVVRTLTRSLSLPLRFSTSLYGELFEQFLIIECWKLISYFQPEYRISYLQTKDDAEIDLVVERPGLPILFVEIKSSTQVRSEDLARFAKLVEDFGKCEAVCFSNDSHEKIIGNIKVLPWQLGLQKYFRDPSLFQAT
jgi:predicted AAA+ superfamily ATPase